MEMLRAGCGMQHCWVNVRFHCYSPCWAWLQKAQSRTSKVQAVSPELGLSPDMLTNSGLPKNPESLFENLCTSSHVPKMETHPNAFPKATTMQLVPSDLTFSYSLLKIPPFQKLKVQNALQSDFGAPSTGHHSPAPPHTQAHTQTAPLLCL